MTWVDPFIFLFLFMVSYTGTVRGFISEISDILILTLGVGIAFSFFTPLGEFFTRVTGINFEYMYAIAWFIVFIPVALFLFIIGAFLDDKASPYYPEKLKSFIGWIVGLAKGVLIMFIFLTFMGHVIESPTILKTLKKSPMVKTIQALEPSAEYFLAPFLPTKFEKKVKIYLRKSVFRNKFIRKKTNK